MTTTVQTNTTSINVLIYLRKLVRLVLFLIASVLDLLSAGLKWTSKNIEIITRVVMVATVLYSLTMIGGCVWQILQTCFAKRILPPNPVFGAILTHFHVSMLAIILSFFFIDRMRHWPIKAWLKKFLNVLIDVLN